MNLHVPRLAAALLVAFLAVSSILFVILMDRFGGPSFGGGPAYSVSASFTDTQGLAKKSDVLQRGVKVGEVGAITVEGDRAKVRLELQERYAPVDRAATVRVGQKTVLGEAYVDLVPGSRRAGTLADGATIAAARVVPAVELDEALGALDEPALASMRSVLKTFSRGAGDPEAAERVNATVGELDTLTGELRRLTSTLKGQERTIAGSVQDSRTVLAELGRRESQLVRIVSGARATLGALAARQEALDGGLRELPRVLSTAQGTLAKARPLLVEARPLLRDLRAAAPALTPAVRDLRPVARDATRVLAGLPRLARVALPVLDRADGVVAVARPAARALDPALANLVPIVDYLAPRRRTLAAWFSQTAALGKQGDAKGRWARFFIFVDPQTGFASPGNLRSNSYTPPDDAENPQPYKAGSYPRLLPYKP